MFNFEHARLSGAGLAVPGSRTGERAGAVRHEGSVLRSNPRRGFKRLRNRDTRAIERLELVPLGRTILRQLAF